MAKDNDYFTSGKPCNDPQMHKVKVLHGTAKPESDRGTRTADSGASSNTVTPAGRSTMEQENGE